MTKRQRAQYVANEIKKVYKADKVIVCWSSGQAKKYNSIGLRKNTVGFAYHLTQGSTLIQCVIPISKNVLYADDPNGHIENSLLQSCGRFIMSHISLMEASQRPESLINEQ